MNAGIRQSQKMQTSLKMTPQMIQAVNLLSCTVDELSEKIYEEVEANPALEIIKDAKHETNIVHVSSKGTGSAADSDAYQNFLESYADSGKTLQEHLLEQLSYQIWDKTEKSIAERLISNLDSHGFFSNPPQSILHETEDEAVLTSVLQKLQDFEPAGIFCNDIRESLIIQTKKFSPQSDVPPFVLPILEDNFALLEHPRPSLILHKISGYEKYGLQKPSLEQIEDAVSFIQALDPYPARQFETRSSTHFISPDVKIRRSTSDEFEETGSKFVVEFISGNLPKIDISKSFKQFSGKDNKVSEMVKDAQWFINSIEQRNQTLIKTVYAILEYQEAFFSGGPKFLQPLRQSDVAQKIGVHESTISRIANGKYIQTEWGLFEIKFFFSNAVVSPAASKAGVNVSGPSKETVKQEIRAIIESEKAKLSDSRLTEILASRGIKVARRTVAKYRSELNISSSFDR